MQATPLLCVVFVTRLTIVDSKEQARPSSATGSVSSGFIHIALVFPTLLVQDPQLIIYSFSVLLLLLSGS